MQCFSLILPHSLPLASLSLTPVHSCAVSSSPFYFLLPCLSFPILSVHSPVPVCMSSHASFYSPPSTPSFILLHFLIFFNPTIPAPLNPSILVWESHCLLVTRLVFLPSLHNWFSSTCALFIITAFITAGPIQPTAGRANHAYYSNWVTFSNSPSNLASITFVLYCAIISIGE